MFTGVTLEQAIKHCKKNKKVIVLDRTTYQTFDFSECIKNYDFLVDVPAVPNLEFEEAIDKGEKSFGGYP